MVLACGRHVVLVMVMVVSPVVCVKNVHGLEDDGIIMMERRDDGEDDHVEIDGEILRLAKEDPLQQTTPTSSTPC